MVWSTLLLTLALGLLGILLLFLTVPVESQANVPCYRTVGGRSWVIGSGCTLTLTGNLGLPAATPQAVVHATPFTFNGYYQPLTAAATASITMTAPITKGIYVIENVGSNAITLIDGGAAVLGGNFVLGQYDVITVRSDATRVVELSRSNN